MSSTVDTTVVTDDSDDSDGLDEYRAALEKIDDAVQHAATLAGDALQCRPGCAACCVDGLSVLPVEAGMPAPVLA